MSVSDDAYVKALEEQCRDWEKMYADLKAERDQLRQQLEIAQGGASAMTERAAQQRLRHV